MDWIVLTDQETPKEAPANVRFASSSLARIRARVDDVLGYPVALNAPYKLCDLRPAYGRIFPDLVSGYEFWGHCDIDIVWGDLNQFITSSILDAYDVISARRGNVAGHFTLYRNEPRFNNLFQEDPRYQRFLQDPRPMFFDEVGMTQIIRKRGDDLRVHWPRFLLNYPDDMVGPGESPSRLGAGRDRWLWEDGRLFHLEEGRRHEIMYLHFMTWKQSMSACEFEVGAKPFSFYISHSHIAVSEHASPPGGIIDEVRRRLMIWRS